MRHRKNLRRGLEIFCAVIVAYLLVYSVLSLGGSYEVTISDLNHAEYGWVPYGFYPRRHQQPNWFNDTLVRIYPSLWLFDQKFIHKNPPQDIRLYPINSLPLQPSTA